MNRAAVALLVLLGFCVSFAHAGEDGWIEMFDGKTWDGWKINENEKSFKIEDGAIVANGDRAHAFYVGADRPFKDFEFKCQVMTKKNSNAGIYFHSKFQDEGWPKFGFEAQVNNSYATDPRKTGSLYAVKDVLEAPAKDDEWFDYAIKVEGRNVTIKINDKTVMEYEEPEDQKAGEDFTRKLDEGTFALQAHDPGSTVMFRKLMVRRLE